MALFSKKLSTFEELCKAYENLSDEDKKAFKQAIADSANNSAEGQEHVADEADEKTADGSEQEAGGAEQTDGADVTGGNGITGDSGDVKVSEESDNAEETSEVAEAENAAEAHDSKAEDNRDEIIEQLSSRIGALEAALKEFGELKERMEDYTRKQAESFGFNGQAVGGKKNYDDMTAAELKSEILNGQH